jgi:hypothetical protein
MVSALVARYGIGKDLVTHHKEAWRPSRPPA